MPNVLSTVAHPPATDARRRRDWRSIRLLVPAMLLLVIFFLLPVLSLLLRSVLEPSPGVHNYAQLVGSTTYLRVFGNTFLVATVVTLATLAIGFPTAWLLAIAPRKLSSLLFAILLLSMWTNLLARTFAWMVLLQQTGPINRMLMALGIISEPLTLVNNLIGVTIGMTYIMLPFLVMPLHATLRSIDPSTLRAAAICGASRWQAFWRILVPLAMPGIASGALMVFVMALGYFVTPALLGGASYMMLAELIAQLVQQLLNWGLAGAAAFVLLAVTLALYALQLRFTDSANATAGGR
jgi:putative spermidine/putrescine transport system permease protein